MQKTAGTWKIHKDLQRALQKYEYTAPLKAPATSHKYTKTAILLAAHKKQQLLQLQMWKKDIFCNIVSDWYKELKVK